MDLTTHIGLVPETISPDINPLAEIIIYGLTQGGQKFRPSDWAERLCGVMSVFGADGRLCYSQYVKPLTVDGIKCVVVDTRLQQIAPQAYHFLMGFARDNELQTRPGRRIPRPQ